MIDLIKKEIQEFADKKQAEILQKIFKTEKGEYGEGDIFLGVKVPVQRKIARKYSRIGLLKIKELMKSKIHEYRMTALIILVTKYKKASEEEKANIFEFYLKNIKYANNWDLVDLSAPNIVGAFLFDKKKSILYNLVQSDNLWERRIAIVSSLYFIKKKEFQDTLALSEILLNDSHDLIQKSVGWMLREVGKRDEIVLENFLKMHYKELPRTTLRYAIERFEEEKRQRYLKSLI